VIADTVFLDQRIGARVGVEDITLREPALGRQSLEPVGLDEGAEVIECGLLAVGY
jgi:hypothetical protein